MKVGFAKAPRGGLIGSAIKKSGEGFRYTATFEVAVVIRHAGTHLVPKWVDILGCELKFIVLKFFPTMFPILNSFRK